MHHWVEHEKPEYMEVAFNSERSIEDELDKEHLHFLINQTGVYVHYANYYGLRGGGVAVWLKKMSYGAGKKK